MDAIISDKFYSAARQQVTVELPIPTLIRALEMVEKGRYRSVDEALAAGIEAIRSSTPSSCPKTATPTIPAHEETRSMAFPLRPVQGSTLTNFAEPVPLEKFSNTLIPLTISRMLPVKLILRYLSAELSSHQNGSISLWDFKESLRRRALQWSLKLREIDASMGRPRGERVSTSFPNEERDPEKSTTRFLDVYVGAVSADGLRARGALPFLGFAGFDEAEGNETVGVTRSGYEFASLSNPMLDDGVLEFPPFSHAEASFLLDCIKNRSPDEHGLMIYYCTLIGQSPEAGTIELSSKMKNYYVRYWDPLKLNQAMVESMRSTLHNRCQELGLVTTTWDGRLAYYRLTEFGTSWLRGKTLS